MSRSRALAVLSSVVATLAMTVGVLAFTSGTASADPRGHSYGYHNHYPPTPPSLVVNKGVVKYGVSVKATGRKYAKKEKVYITVYFRAKGSHRVKVVKTATVWTDKNGKFSINIKMSRPGTVLISAKGKTSRKTAVAAVYVVDKRNGSGSWSIRPVAYSTGLTGPGAGAGPTTLTSTEQSTSSGGAGLAIAGLGVLGLAGSAVLTRQTIRRRRGSAAA
jgi:hypothetical protein